MNTLRHFHFDSAAQILALSSFSFCLGFSSLALGQEYPEDSNPEQPPKLEAVSAESQLDQPQQIPAPLPEIQQSTPVQITQPGASEPAADKKVKRKLKIRARIHAGYELSREQDRGADSGKSDLENSFVVERARLKLSWDPYRWLRGVVQLGVDERLELGSSLLRDAYIHLSLLPQMELRVGQFKKPFSALELMSPAKLKVVDRGIGNKLVVSDLLYGGRDLGLMLTGRIIDSVKLDYALGAFNGSGPDIKDPGLSKDLVARLKLRPVEWLSLGVSGALKLFDDTLAGQPKRGYALGGDIKLSLAGFVLLTEVTVAEHNEAWRTSERDTGERSPLILDAVGIASHRMRLPVDALPMAVEPVFKYELLDPHSVIVDDEISTFTPGVNLYIGKYLRLMVDGEFLRAARNGKSEYPDSETLWTILCLDI